MNSYLINFNLRRFESFLTSTDRRSRSEKCCEGCTGRRELMRCLTELLVHTTTPKKPSSPDRGRDTRGPTILWDSWYDTQERRGPRRAMREKILDRRCQPAHGWWTLAARGKRPPEMCPFGATCPCPGYVRGIWGSRGNPTSPPSP